MPPESPMTVLVVEDDPGIAELERSRLVDAGFAVVIAPSAEDTIRHVNDGGIDLILLDYRLPGGQDGLDLYAQLKAMGCDLPVILVTGYSDEATAVRALRAGVRDFVTKSVEYLDYLPEAVQRALRQVQTERRLAESQARLAGVIESAKDAVIVVEGDGGISLFNPAAELMFGCPAAAALGRPITEFIPNELAPAVDAADLTMSHRVRSGSRGIRADGTTFPLEASVSRGKADGRTFYTTVVRDITRRKRAEEELRLRDRAIQAVPHGIIITDPTLSDNPIVYVSPGCEALTGYPSEESVGRNCRFLQGHDTDQEAVAKLREAVALGNPCTVELVNYRKDGTPFWNALTVTPVRDDDGRLTHFVGVLIDATERRQMEQQLQQLQKMEAVGQLAGGVAHDFNNLLTVINGYSDLALDLMAANDPHRAALAAIRDAGERATGLTSQLLTFSRRALLEPKVLDPNAVVTETAKMLRRLIGEDIAFATTLDPIVSRVRVDPGQMGQVLMNLAVNARDAMPTGGQLTIETRDVDLGPDYAKRHPGVRPGRYVMTAVTDTGTGMPKDVQDRVFEPFFTTKGAGKGTGIGLATVYGIVKQSGGHVEVYSEVGHGTTFKVYLPAVDDPASASGFDALKVVGGTETILLVEDQTDVRTFAILSLQTYGYTVLSATDGHDAMRIAMTGPPIDVLVTDVVMPGMSGRELSELLRARDPKMKVLFLSGYTDDAIVRHGVLKANVAFLQKPYTPLALARKVREVLDLKDANG